MRKRYRKLQPKQLQGNETFFKPTIQKKLNVGKPGDKYEVEADVMADKVTNKNNGETKVQRKEGEEDIQQKPLGASVTPLVQKMEGSEEESVQTKQEALQLMEEEESVQKMESGEEDVQTKCADCEEDKKVQKMEENETAQTKTNGEPKSPTSIEGKLKSSSGKGNKMNKETAAEMEKGFGVDFGKVNIHTDENAIQMSKTLGAQAFTHGNDIYFNKGKYNPNSKEGKHLLAHELTHTIQQTGMIQKSLAKDYSEDLEADKFRESYRLEQAHDNKRLIEKGSRGEHVRKLQKGLMGISFDLPNYGADGDFGTETKKAVTGFQSEFGLAIDGIVGPETIGRLDDIYSGKNLDGNCCGEGFQLPQTGLTFNINSSVMTKMTFCSKGDFKISSFGDWVKPHNAKHYHIFLTAIQGGTIHKINRRYDVGRTETQSFKVKTKGCIFFKVIIKVISPGTSPNLKGSFSVTN